MESSTEVLRRRSGTTTLTLTASHSSSTCPTSIPGYSRHHARCGEFELETNAGIQQYKHLNAPEDAGETEIMATLQAANDALNAKHAAKVKREFEVAERARLERTARSDAWAYISGLDQRR